MEIVSWCAIMKTTEKLRFICLFICLANRLLIIIHSLFKVCFLLTWTCICCAPRKQNMNLKPAKSLQARFEANSFAFWNRCTFKWCRLPLFLREFSFPISGNNARVSAIAATQSSHHAHHICGCQYSPTLQSMAGRHHGIVCLFPNVNLSRCWKKA